MSVKRPEEEDMGRILSVVALSVMLVGSVEVARGDHIQDGRKVHKLVRSTSMTQRRGT